MKTMIAIAFLFMFNYSPVNGQEQDDQKSIAEQIIQIAANGVYLDFIKKGYRIAHEGLELVSGFKGGEYDMHKSFFDSLEEVNAEVKNYDRASHTRVFNKTISEMDKDFITWAAKERTLSEKELRFFKGVSKRLTEDCELIFNEVNKIRTEGAFRMEANERIERMEMLFEALLANYLFYRRFTTEAFQLVKGRQRELAEIEISKRLYDQNFE